MISIWWSVVVGALALVPLVMWFRWKWAGKGATEGQLREFDYNFAAGRAKLFFFPLAGVALLLFIFACVVAVKPGHAGVSRLFGKVDMGYHKPGLHFTNPFRDWVQFDCREKTLKQSAMVPAKDQLFTRFEVSVQYKLIPSMAPKMLDETGMPEQVIKVHLVPKTRSLMREIGKTVERSEDFFKAPVQDRLQRDLLSHLRAYMAPLGVQIKAVLVRDIRPPKIILAAIEKKKQRWQKAEQQKAELQRFKIEQQQRVEKANARLVAARKDAERKIVLAKAKAKEIALINAAIAHNPAYIKLRALKALEVISQSKSSKFFFLDGKSPMPLPLMHLGAGIKKP